MPLTNKTKTIDKTTMIESPSEADIVEHYIPGDEKNFNVLVERVSASLYQGPLPAPEDLEKYEKILPGSSERVFTMAESEQKHRHDIDIIDIELEMKKLEAYKDEISRKHKETCRGQNYAVIICVMVILAGVFFMYRGFANSGLLLITTTLLGVITGFINNNIQSSKKKNKQNNKKNKANKDTDPPDNALEE